MAASEKAVTNSRHPTAQRAHTQHSEQTHGTASRRAAPGTAFPAPPSQHSFPGAQRAQQRPPPSTANTAQLQHPAKQSRAPGRRSHWPGFPRRAVICVRGARGGARLRCESRRPSGKFGAVRAACREQSGSVSPAPAVGSNGSSVPARLSDGGGGARAAARASRCGGARAEGGRAVPGLAVPRFIPVPDPRSFWWRSGSGRSL